METKDMCEYSTEQINQEKFIRGLLDCVPTLSNAFLFADYYSRQDDKMQFEIKTAIERFQKFGKEGKETVSQEALYRGKRTFDNQWVYGSYVTYKFLNYGLLYPEDVTEDFVVRNGIRAIEPLRVSKETVGRYTGLIDFEGNRVFEGDIIETVKTIHKTHWIGCVQFGDGCYESGKYMDEDEGYIGFYIEPSTENYMSGNDIKSWINFYGIRVLGNLYDNEDMAEKHGFTRFL